MLYTIQYFTLSAFRWDEAEAFLSTCTGLDHDRKEKYLKDVKLIQQKVEKTLQTKHEDEVCEKEKQEDENRNSDSMKLPESSKYN